MKIVNVRYGGFESEQEVDESLYDAIYQQGKADERRNLLIWLMQKEYLCQVFTDEDEDFDGNRTYETVTQYLDVDEVLEEYEDEIKEGKE